MVQSLIFILQKPYLPKNTHVHSLNYTCYITTLYYFNNNNNNNCYNNNNNNNNNNYYNNKNILLSVNACAVFN